jgi:Fic family protein
LAWFLDCLDRAIDASDTMLASVLRKARLWQRINTKPVNERQRKAINRMLQHDWQGNMNTSKYARLVKCSQDTALRDIKELLERGVLLQNEGGGRSTSYRLVDPDTF